LRKRRKHSRRVAEFRNISGLHHLAVDEHDDAIRPVQGVVKVAVEKSNTILNDERSDWSNYPTGVRVRSLRLARRSKRGNSSTRRAICSVQSRHACKRD
jgi:hypothetical protein